LQLARKQKQLASNSGAFLDDKKALAARIASTFFTTECECYCNKQYVPQTMAASISELVQTTSTRELRKAKQVTDNRVLESSFAAELRFWRFFSWSYKVVGRLKSTFAVAAWLALSQQATIDSVRALLSMKHEQSSRDLGAGNECNDAREQVNACRIRKCQSMHATSL
jgi:hypothetical protein